MMVEANEEDLLARSIGRLVIEASRAEGTAGELLMLHRDWNASVKNSSWHESGEPLVKALRNLATQLGLTELTDIADRLSEAAEWRHDVVHGEWLTAPGVGILTFRRQRPKVAPDGGYAGRIWTIELLEGLAADYRNIGRGLDDLISNFIERSKSSH